MYFYNSGHVRSECWLGGPGHWTSQRGLETLATLATRAQDSRVGLPDLLHCTWPTDRIENYSLHCKDDKISFK